MTCIRCGTSIPSYATACSGCTRDIYGNDDAGVGLFDARNIFFLVIMGIAVALIKLISWVF